MEKESPTTEQKVLTDNMKIEKVYLTSVMPYDKNAKKHPEAQIQGIMKSIDELGYNDPIALDEKNVIIEGHGRFEALQRLNSDGRFNRIKILRLSNLTKNQIKAYRIAHNKLNMDTGFDNNILNDELEFLEENSFNLDTTGFTSFEVGNLRDKILVSEHERGFSNNEIDVDKFGNDLDQECPKCKFKFKGNEIKSSK